MDAKLIAWILFFIILLLLPQHQEAKPSSNYPCRCPSKLEILATVVGMNYEILYTCTKLEIPYSSICSCGSSSCNGSFVICVVRHKKWNTLFLYPIHVRATIKYLSIVLNNDNEMKCNVNIVAR